MERYLQTDIAAHLKREIRIAGHSLETARGGKNLNLERWYTRLHSVPKLIGNLYS